MHRAAWISWCATFVLAGTAAALAVDAPLVTLNEKEYRDRVQACWLGKNIGGALGAPFDGNPSVQNIDPRAGVTPGESINNYEGLAMQLLWLKAMEEHDGHVDARILSEYWIKNVATDRNEYGVAKHNLAAGVMPPLSGEYENTANKNRNGAWARTELWACLAPGCPGLVARMVREDACVDHGTAEGTLAAMFVASIESAAFVEHERDQLLAIGLSMVPEQSGVARGVRAALTAKRTGLDWASARSRVIEATEDTGWGCAPRNLGFMVIGWLYGDGDFGRSLCAAVNCGDGAASTGGALGAILGIIYGTDNIPAVWRTAIGTAINTSAVKDITLTADINALTDAVTAMAEQVLKLNDAPVAIGTIASDMRRASELTLSDPEAASALWRISPFQTPWIETDLQVSADYLDPPVFTPGKPRIIRLDLTNNAQLPLALTLKTATLPAGWIITGVPSSTLNVAASAAHSFELILASEEGCKEPFKTTLEINGATKPIQMPLVLFPNPQQMADTDSAPASSKKGEGKEKSKVKPLDDAKFPKSAPLSEKTNLKINKAPSTTESDRIRIKYPDQKVKP